MQLRFIRFLGILMSQLRIGRTLFLLCVYSGIFAVSLWLGYLLRFDFVIPESYQAQYIVGLPVVILLKLLMLFFMGQFGILLSYFRLPDLYRITLALLVSSILLVQAWYLLDGISLPPRSVLLADFIFSLFLMAGFRMSLRVYRERYQGESERKRKQKRVAIIGAGMTGSNLAYDLMSRSNSGLRPVVFLDDDRAKWNHKVHGIPIVGASTDLESAKKRFGIEGVILSMSSATARRILEITERANSLSLSTDIVPSITELATGQVRASRIRPVEIEDTPMTSGH
jgi:FlaA1/EpsC-like NDP-sugar epimerase